MFVCALCWHLKYLNFVAASESQDITPMPDHGGHHHGHVQAVPFGGQQDGQHASMGYSRDNNG